MKERERERVGNMVGEVKLREFLLALPQRSIVRRFTTKPRVRPPSSVAFY